MEEISGPGNLMLNIPLMRWYRFIIFRKYFLFTISFKEFDRKSLLLSHRFFFKFFDKKQKLKMIDLQSLELSSLKQMHINVVLQERMYDTKDYQKHFSLRTMAPSPSTVQDFLNMLGLKPCIHIVERSLFLTKSCHHQTYQKQQISYIQSHFLVLKFIFSEKATKFCEISINCPIIQ